MHRKEEFETRVKEWLNLELDKTCVSLDTYTSMEIRRSNPNGVGGTITFTQKRKGNETEDCRVYLRDDNTIDSFVMQTSTPIFGLMLYALEKAVETN